MAECCPRSDTEIVYKIPDPGQEPEPAEEEECYSEMRQQTNNALFSTGKRIAFDRRCYCDNCFHDWVDKLKYDAVFTRERLAFLSNVWDIRADMDYALNDFDFQGYNSELYNILCADKGQLMLETFPTFRSEMEEIIYELAIDGVREWEVYWADVFGCDIDDARYWAH